MTDFSKLTDGEINEQVRRVRFNTLPEDDKPLFLPNYLSDDAFCMGLIKELRVDIEFSFDPIDPTGALSLWTVDYHGVFEVTNKSLNRAICEVYLMIKEGGK